MQCMPIWRCVIVGVLVFGGTSLQSAIATAQSATTVSPLLEPAPGVLDLKGKAVWDGRPTLRGIWIAHPEAGAPVRVRIVNTRTGKAADGALFRREATLAKTNVLISAEAARAIGMVPDQPDEVRIVAIQPVGSAPARLKVPATAATGTAGWRTAG